jgi:uncharacterized protein YjdB
MKILKYLRLFSIQILIFSVLFSCDEIEKIENISKIEIIEGDSIIVSKGFSGQLNIRWYPEYLESPKCIWNSDNNYVIRIDELSGAYLARSIGQSIISVKCADLPLTAECLIMVKSIATQNIEMAVKEKEMSVGDEYRLSVFFYPENASSKDLYWSSSDSNIATVDNYGKIKAIKEGECYIYAKTINNLIAECKIIVKDVEVEKIAFDLQEKTLTVGENFTISVIFTPHNATCRDITWSSTDTRIAKVDNKGMVTAVGDGECFILAQTKNGKKANCKLLVSPLPVQNIEFKEPKVKLLVGDKKRLAYNIIPSNAKVFDIKWKVENENIASISDGVVTSVFPGKTNVVLTVNGDVTATCQIECTDNIEEYISFSSGGGGATYWDGYYVLPGSSLGSEIRNQSTQNIVLKDIILYDSYSGEIHQTQSINKTIGGSSSYKYWASSINKPIYMPIFRWTITFKGEEYVLEHKIPHPLENIW